MGAHDLPPDYLDDNKLSEQGPSGLYRLQYGDDIPGRYPNGVEGVYQVLHIGTAAQHSCLVHDLLFKDRHTVLVPLGPTLI